MQSLVVLVACGNAAGPAGNSHAQVAPGSIADFMIMQVCVDDGGRVIPGMSPVDRGCVRRRKIGPDDAIPYELHNFRPHARGCAGELGSIAKVNLPVERHGVTRIVSSYEHDLSAECAAAGLADAAARAEPSAGDADAQAGYAPSGGARPTRGGGASVQWFDDKYGFIMGSWSPVALSSFVGATCGQGSHSSQRFAHGWVIAPTTVPTTRGVYGYQTFRGALEAGTPDASRDCSGATHAGFTTWVRDQFTFTSNLTLDAIMSEHYSQASDAGDAPGRAEQVERTYWTKEFGVSRWEKWSRDDWVNSRNGMTAQQQGQALYRSGDCDPPYVVDAAVSRDLGYHRSSEAGAYTRQVSQPGEGSHVWYMTLCEDYTNVVKPRIAVARTWLERLQDAYWSE
jgi:hypothetical protein